MLGSFVFYSSVFMIVMVNFISSRTFFEFIGLYSFIVGSFMSLFGRTSLVLVCFFGDFVYLAFVVFWVSYICLNIVCIFAGIGVFFYTNSMVYIVNGHVLFVWVMCVGVIGMFLGFMA